MRTGTVKFYNNKSKFGFIKDHESDQEYYTHEKYLTNQIEADDVVEFEVVPAKRGPVATQVRRIEQPT